MRAVVIRGVLYGAGLLALVLSVQAGVMARIDYAPEIDGNSISAGVGLLASSVFLLRARFGRK